MDCNVFMPLRITVVAVSLGLTCGCIGLILWHGLHHKRKPITYLLHVLSCQALMALCAIAFAAVAFVHPLPADSTDDGTDSVIRSASVAWTREHRSLPF